MNTSEQHENEDVIRRSMTVPLPIERAFIIFTKELGTWWPPEYTWSGDVLETIGMETRKVEKASE